MNYYPLALVILLAFAGGWVWRGAFDVWRGRGAKVYGTTGTVSTIRPDVTWDISTAAATITASLSAEPLPDPPRRLRAVD